ncbi:MAG: UDP-N-acetylmuramoyl-L-alanine--D-glutamate ligase [Alphaproteobacteria bacterium]
MKKKKPEKNLLYFVLGLGRTGLAAIHWLQQQGNTSIMAWDDQPAARAQAQSLGVQVTTQVPWSTVLACVQSPGISPDHPLSLKAVAAGAFIITDFDLFNLHYPNFSTIGITGTNGKSTTAALMHHALQSAGWPTLLGGNIGTPVLSLDPTNMQWGVWELSSYQLELSASLDLDVAVWLNLEPDHLERHKTMEAYKAAKSKIFQGVKWGAVLGVDDPYLNYISKTIHDVPVIPISVKQEVGIYSKDGWLVDTIFANGKRVLCLDDYPRLRGEHNHQNIAAVYAVSRLLGLPVETIAQGIASFPGLQHRQQWVRQIGDIVFINDSKGTNVDATARALACFDDIYWILGGIAKTQGLEALMEYFPKVRHAFLIGEAQESFAKVLDGSVEYTKCGTMNVAVAEAYVHAKLASSKAVVLLSPACASFDQYPNFEVRGDDFCALVQGLEGQLS